MFFLLAELFKFGVLFIIFFVSVAFQIFMQSHHSFVLKLDTRMHYHQKKSGKGCLRGRSGFLEIVFVGQCEVLVCL